MIYYRRFRNKLAILALKCSAEIEQNRIILVFISVLVQSVILAIVLSFLALFSPFWYEVIFSCL